MKLEDLKGISALKKLKDYKGKNPYIKKLKFDHENTRGGISLTATQSAYVLKNYEYEPLLVNRVITITEYLGIEMQKTYKLSFQPERILFEYILGETEKSIHVYGKLKRNQEKSEMYFIPKSQLLDDPYFEDIDIDVDFEKYTKLDTMVLKDGTVGRTPYKHQIEGVKFLLTRNGCILADDMGLGKAIADDVPVLTPDGWIPHGTLKVGDYVIGSNGSKTKVLEVHPQPLKDYYNITFTDGTIVESCDEHLWNVQTTNHKKRNSGYQTKPLKDLIGDLTYGNKGNVKWYIPMIKPVIFNVREVFIDPYILGCILGDGGISGHNIKLSSEDSELIQEVNDRLPRNHRLHFIKNHDYQLCGNNGVNKIIRHLSDYELIGLNSETKFIPKDYLYNTKTIRLELLQGLLDTDGYCSSKDGTIQYYSISRELTNGVKELVQSFGGVARETSKIGKYKLPDDTNKECKKCFILTINLPEDIIPFKLQRKIGNMKRNRKYLPSRGIKSIEYSRTTHGQCISVEAKDSLYVMDQYVVTHNTYQSIIAALESGAERVLIVCPSAVKINWQREIQYFQCEDTSIINGKKWKQAKFTIINYDILKNFWVTDKQRKEYNSGDFVWENEHLVKGNFDLCIIDEAHYLKDHKSQRGSIMKDLCVKHNIPKVWLLTGTPVANRPKDYYNLLALIKAPIAKDWMFYVTRYCEARSFFKQLKNGKKKKIWLTNGASNLEELATKTKNLFLRRLKTDIDDMPDKIITPVYHVMSKKEEKEYENLWDEYLIERKKNKKRGDVDRDLVELILLRQFIANITIPKTIEMVDNALEQDQKVIIFTNFTEELQTLHQHFGSKSVIHYGEMSETNKQVSVDLFQKNPDKKIFIGNIKSAGVGITLTEGTIVIFNSFDWVTGNNEQAEDRAYRIGQKNHVNVYYQLFDDTIATRMWEVLKQKKEIINTIIGDGDINDDDEIVELLMDKLIEEL
jgi:hypothetical protein